MTSKEYNSFHSIEEREFNKLNGLDRLKYILEKFPIGMSVDIRVGKTDTMPVDRQALKGIVIGFHKSGISITSVRDGSAKIYTEMPYQEETIPNTPIPDCNVTVMIDGKLESYYPLWAYPDLAKIRNEKLEKIGI